MKESFLIDIHASIDGVMNPRDGTQKDACWNSIISILKKCESRETSTCAPQLDRYEFLIGKLHQFHIDKHCLQLDNPKASCIS